MQVNYPTGYPTFNKGNLGQTGQSLADPLNAWKNLTGSDTLGLKVLDPLNVFGFQKSSSPTIPYATGPAAQASGVKLNTTLADALGGIGAGQSQNIAGTYGNLRSQAASGAGPKGIAPGSYADQRFITGQGLANQNLGAGLEGVLGNEGYQSFKNNRDFNQNMALAQYTGEINKPSLLEQALSGLGGGAQAGGMAFGLYNSLKKNPSQNPGTNYTPTSTPDYGYYNSGGSGLNLYGY